MIPYHPNINPITGKFGNFMFSVELDGIMWDILQMLLYEQEHILPHDNSTDAIDFALNKDAMNWYLSQDKEKLYSDHKIYFKNSLLLSLRKPH